VTEERAPVWARDAKPKRTSLSRESIVAAAMAIADAEGLDAVSIRRVAAELGARAMSLYTYIDRKEDLWDLMSDEVAAEILVPGELPGDWREATIAIALREREATRRHPWVVDLATRSSMVARIGPNMLRHSEQSIAALDTLDASEDEKWQLMAAVNDYCTGYAVRNARQDAGGGEYLRELTRNGDFPRLASMLKTGSQRPDEGAYERGLRWLLDGFLAELSG
jgi:AcrR family transcriptional regulator